MESFPRVTAATAPAISAWGIARDLLRFTRMHEWHPGKIPLVLGFAFILALTAPRPGVDFIWIAIAYMFACLYLATGYMLNNVADTEQDQAVDKLVGLEALSPRIRVVPVVVSAILGLGLGLALLPPAAAAALFGCHGLAWLYSFPPRLKEHVVFGPLVAAFAQVPAPALTLALAWGALPPTALVYVVVTFLYGLRMVLVHQIIDHDNDVRTSTRTTATVLGLDATGSLLRTTFGAEFLGTAVLVVLLASAGLPALLLVSLIWPLLLALVRWRRGERLRLASYAFIPLADIHESLMPLILVVALGVRDGGMMIGACLVVLALFADHHLERLVRPLTRWEQNHV